MGGGAWPFLVGGVICLVNSVNERDRCLLNSWMSVLTLQLLRGTWIVKIQEDSGNNRSVMPLDVLGRTRVALMHSTSLQPWPRGLGNLVNVHRDGQIIEIVNLERGIPSKRRSSICIDYVPALCTHRPSHLPIGWSGEASGLWFLPLCCGVTARTCLNLVI